MARSRGYCNPHYQCWYKWGDPLYRRTYVRTDPADRIEKYLVRRGSDECWGWTGRSFGKNVRGGAYPLLIDQRDGKPKGVYAHRLMYEREVGLIPEGYEVDHLCYNTKCLNPAHLEAVTPAENRRRRRLDRDGATQQYRGRG